MGDAYICEAARTAGGRRGGRLSEVHPADLGGIAIDAVVERTGIAPEAVDDVIYGCVSQVGPQTFNVARTAILSSCLPESVPGVTIDRQCGSSQQAAQFAAQAIMSGTQDVVIAGGVEVMSAVPILSAMTAGVDAGMASPFDGKKISARYPGEEFSQFVGAERVAQKYGVTREELLDFAEASHVKALEATDDGRFVLEIIPVEVAGEDGPVVHDRDEGMRPPNRAKMESLQPLVPDGLINAAMASQICDGSSAVLMASERAVEEHGLTPLARIHAMDVCGSDPTMVLEGPIPATQRVLERAGMTIDEIDLYEVNEAFGSVPLAWTKALGADLDKLNVNGGAQALGHPLGATGTKLLGTLVHELRRRGGRYGVLSICEGLGTANAMVVEAL
ncbi:MAG: acetyl-CoA C-acyltransferase [Solirubrobacteraceae bacterium]|nr:acetyl-CoA C-acyltransferase [Solirubrobacteraceae bacterium]